MGSAQSTPSPIPAFSDYVPESREVCSIISRQVAHKVAVQIQILVVAPVVANVVSCLACCVGFAVGGPFVAAGIFGACLCLILTWAACACKQISKMAGEDIRDFVSEAVQVVESRKKKI